MFQGNSGSSGLLVSILICICELKEFLRVACSMYFFVFSLPQANVCFLELVILTSEIWQICNVGKKKPHCLVSGEKLENKVLLEKLRNSDKQ